MCLELGRFGGGGEWMKQGAPFEERSRGYQLLPESAREGGTPSSHSAIGKSPLFSFGQADGALVPFFGFAFRVLGQGSGFP